MGFWQDYWKVQKMYLKCAGIMILVSIPFSILYIKYHIHENWALLFIGVGVAVTIYITRKV